MQQMTIRKIPDEVMGKLRVLAAQQGSSLEKLVRESLIQMAGGLEVAVAPAKNNEPRGSELGMVRASEIPVPSGGKCTMHKRVRCTARPECVEELTGERPEVQEWA